MRFKIFFEAVEKQKAMLLKCIADYYDEVAK